MLVRCTSALEIIVNGGVLTENMAVAYSKDLDAGGPRAAHHHHTQRLYSRNCMGSDTVPLVTKYSCHTAVTIWFPCYI